MQIYAKRLEFGRLLIEMKRHFFVMDCGPEDYRIRGNFPIYFRHPHYKAAPLTRQHYKWECFKSCPSLTPEQYEMLYKQLPMYGRFEDALQKENRYDYRPNYTNSDVSERSA